MHWSFTFPGAQGVDHEVRAELWPLLLGLYSPFHTVPERLVALAELRARYLELLLQCQVGQG